MALSSYQTLSSANYRNLRFGLVRQAEGFRSLPYTDSAQGNNPTIGVGFNLDVSGVREEVLNALNITGGLRDRIEGTIRNTSATTDSELQSELDEVLQDWAANHSDYDGPTTFALTEDQAWSVFDAIDDTYETKIDDWLSGIPASRERAALYSLAYNTKDGSTSLLGDGLKTAIENGNRAEAWYEIRYNSNSLAKHAIEGWELTEGEEDQLAVKHDDGIAKRRFAEAAVFGRTDGTPVSEQEALGTYAMFANHRDYILDYVSGPRGLHTAPEFSVS